MIARLCGLGLDARRATRTRDPIELAQASRWVAANLLAIRGLRVVLAGELPTGARLVGVHTANASGLLAVLAAVPALVDGAQLPASWRLALRALGLPMLDGGVAEALAGGASVIVPARPRMALALEVVTVAAAHRIEVVCPELALAA